MIKELMTTHRAYYNSGVTRQLPVRLNALRRFGKELALMEEEILKALVDDFGKPNFEAYLSEFATATLELNHTIKHLEEWAKPEEIQRSVGTMMSKAIIQKEPLGVILVISPFNYPVLLTLAPIIAAVAAGNTAIVKMSSLAPHTSAALDKLIRRSFRPGHVSIIAGAEGINQAILEERYDKIMFTGSSQTGKEIMAKAAQTLTPVLLELAGRNPAIILRDADVFVAAKKIAWGKFINAGQSCIAPDHVYVHREVKTAFLEELKLWIYRFYGEDPAKSDSFGRIASLSKVQSIHQKMTSDLNIVAGGMVDETNLYIAPTVVTDVPLDHPLMQGEIFGPILPVNEYSDINEVISSIRQQEKPLAAYVFGQDLDFALSVLERIPAGGGGINETMLQAASATLPFGGVGNSGMGSYHGKYGFDAFSHTRSTVIASPNITLPFIYPPYDEYKIRLVKAFLKKLI